MTEYPLYMVTTTGKKVRRETFSTEVNALAYYDIACKRADGRVVTLEYYTEVIEDMQGKDGIWRTRRFKTNSRILYTNVAGDRYRDKSKE